MTDSTTLFDIPRRISNGSQGHATSSDPSIVAESPRHLPPPTPELPPASSFDFARPSPTQTSAPGSSGRASHYSAGTTSTNPEYYAQRPPTTYVSYSEGASTYPSIGGTTRFPSTPPAPRPHSLLREPAALVAPSISQPENKGENLTYRGLVNQRPLPTNFPPALPPMDVPMAPTWQHHHYYPPANPPNYPQAQERYACSTCNKHFSRPSSLKIHTHSHTGEKPFKCNHEGCGKYFSVRSNMKRHEKGCHGGSPSSEAGTSPE